MPTKNIAASNTAIMPSFRGGLSLRICLSKSSWSRRSILRSPFCLCETRQNCRCSTDCAGTLGSLIGGAYPWPNGGVGHQFRKIKHQSAQGCGEPRSVSRLAQTGPEQALSSLIWIMREGANAVPDDEERFRSLRAVCLVAHQRTAWAMPERTLSVAKRIATPLTQACQKTRGGRGQSRIVTWPLHAF
jgi:hypothetical protein